MNSLIQLKFSQKLIIVFASMVIFMCLNVAKAITTNEVSLNKCSRAPFYNDSLLEVIGISRKQRDGYLVEFMQKKKVLIENYNLLLKKLPPIELNKSIDIDSLTLNDKETLIILIIEFERVLNDVKLIMQQIKTSDAFLEHVRAICFSSYADNNKYKQRDPTLDKLISQLKSLLSVELVATSLDRNMNSTNRIGEN